MVEQGREESRNLQVLTDIWEIMLGKASRIQKNSTDEPICRAGIETNAQGVDVWTPGGGQWDEQGAWD